MYVVERFVVGWTDDEIRELLAREHDLRSTFAAEGVRLLGSVVVAADEMCLSFFEGPDQAIVAAVNQRGALPVDRVLAATASSAGIPWVAAD